MSLHTGTAGAEIQVPVIDPITGGPMDLTPYTTPEIIFTKPDLTIVARPATLVGLATNGIIETITPTGFFSNAAGKWKARPHLTQDASHDYPGDDVEFFVAT